MEERLQKFLSRCGVASRRASESLITKGRVKVNGNKITVQGLKIDPKSDIVEVDGKVVRPMEKLIYIALNKPRGYITTRKDKHAKKTVYDLLPKDLINIVHPVGRLDQDTEGLLILTNDGQLTLQLTHPSLKHEKEYEVLCKGNIKNQVVEKLKKGIILDGKKTAPAKIRIIEKNENESKLSVTLHEGRKRQIRRMFSQVAYPVLKLKRIRISHLNLGRIKEGHYKVVSKKEILNGEKTN